MLARTAKSVISRFLAILAASLLALPPFTSCHCLCSFESCAANSDTECAKFENSPSHESCCCCIASRLTVKFNSDEAENELLPSGCNCDGQCPCGPVCPCKCKNHLGNPQPASDFEQANTSYGNFEDSEPVSFAGIDDLGNSSAVKCMNAPFLAPQSALQICIRLSRLTL